MKGEFLRHKLSYFVLIFGLSFFVMIFLGAWPNRAVERAGVVSLAVFYFAWGILSHLKEEHVTKRIISEYASISFLAAFLLFLITL